MIRISSIVFCLLLLSCNTLKTLSKPESHKAELRSSLQVIQTDNDLNEISFGSCVITKKEPTDLGFKITCLTAKHMLTTYGADNVKHFISYTPLELYSPNNTSFRFSINKISLHPTKDLAFITANVDFTVGNLLVASKIDNSPAEIGDKVVLIGFPLGGGVSVTEGYIGARDLVTRRIKVTSPAVFGNSGGGVFQKDTGELVGILVDVTVLNFGFTSIIVFHLASIEDIYSELHWVNSLDI